MESFINHEDVKKDIPQKIQDHLRGLIGHSKLAQTEQTMRKLIEAWLLKKAMFQKMTEHSNFLKTRAVPKDGRNGCIALTLSGSIVSVGPLINDRREIKYTSLGFRTDVPESLVVQDARLARDIECDKPLVCLDGPLEKTSAVMDLAAAPEEASQQEQTRSLERLGEKLKSDFIKLNREAREETAQAELLRTRDDLFGKWIIIRWFLIGGMEKHVFMARLKILWLELFTQVYDAVSRKISDPQARDALFLDFTNQKFAKFIDDYKWYESERKDFDIGLMKALEELPEYNAYIGFVNGYINRL